VNRPVRPHIDAPVPYVCGAGRTKCGRPARLYAAGWRCAEHTPARQAGEDEPLSTPQEAKA
jgi:hypothetical protein